MMNGLIIDTTKEEQNIVITQNENVYLFTGAKKRRHTSEFLPLLDKALKSKGLTLDEIDVVGVVTGPGSYTGIRIGTSIANSFKTALNLKLVEITSLEYHIFNKENAVAIMDSGHDFYALIKENQTLTYKILFYGEEKKLNVEIVDANSFNLNNLCSFFKHKVELQEFSNLAKPFYLKKSSAEM